MDTAVAIDPKGQTPTPGFAFERRVVPKAEIHYDVVTNNGYRVTLVSSVSEDLNEVGFVGTLYQALVDFEEFDPRATLGEKYASTPRKTSLEEHFLGKQKDAVTMHMYVVVSNVTTKGLETELGGGNTHLGRFPYHIANYIPEYFSQEGRGRVMETNYRGIPAPGHKEFFHAFEVPYFKVGLEPLGNGYTKEMMKQDFVHGIANGLEMMTDEIRWPDPALRKSYKGMSVSKTSKVATIGDTAIHSMDFIVNSKCQAEIKTSAATLSYLSDRNGNNLWIDNNAGKAPGQHVAIAGFYRSEVSPAFEKDIRVNEEINLRATFGAYTHQPTGDGKEMHLFQTPQYLGEPMWKDIGPLKKANRMTHSEQVRNYLMALATGRSMSPKGSDMRSSHPRFDSGIYYKSAEFDVIKRTAYCRYYVKDTPETKREIEAKAACINWQKFDQNPMSTWWASKHDYRGQAGQYAVQYPGSGLVLLDVNMGLGHSLDRFDYRPSSELGWYVVERMARIVRHHLDEGVTFQTSDSRVVMSASESGGHRFYPEMGEYLSRLWWEIDAHSPALQEGKKAVDEYQDLSVGNFSVEAIEAMVAGETNGKLTAAERAHMKPQEAFFELERRVAELRGATAPSEAELQRLWEQHGESFALDYTTKWSHQRTRIYRVSEYCEALKKDVAIWQVYDVLTNRNAAASSIIMRQAECVNKPHFYGPKDPTSGNPLFALSWLLYSMEEDFARPGVWLKREMRMFDGNIRNIMYLLGYRMKRKEAGHDWDEESKRLAIDSEGRFKRGGKMVKTAREEITFHFKNFFIWEFDPELWKSLYPEGTKFEDVAPHIMAILQKLQNNGGDSDIDYSAYRNEWTKLRQRTDLDMKWVFNLLGYDPDEDVTLDQIFMDIQQSLEEIRIQEKGDDTSWQIRTAQLEMAHEVLISLLIAEGGEMPLEVFSHPGMPKGDGDTGLEEYLATAAEFRDRADKGELTQAWALRTLGYDLEGDFYTQQKIIAEKEALVREAKGANKAILEVAFQIALATLPDSIEVAGQEKLTTTSTATAYEQRAIELAGQYRANELTPEWALSTLGYAEPQRVGLTMEAVASAQGARISGLQPTAAKAELELALRIAFDFLPSEEDLVN